MLRDEHRIEGIKRSAKDYKISEHYAKEWIKCGSNPLYFIFNYAQIPQIGGSLQLKPNHLTKKIRRTVRTVLKHHNVVLMASRQLGKSTIAACIIAWSVIFHKQSKVLILNMKKDAGLNNIGMVKHIIKNLPSWMVGNNPFTSKSDIKTYFDLFNGSKVQVFYPSTIHSPDTLSRSLTSSMLYIDEAAFIRYMSEIYGSAQQTLSTAIEQAKERHYPYFQLVTSTPNGIIGDGEWFYRRFTNAVDSDQLFEPTTDDFHEDWKDDKFVKNTLNDPNKNGFVRIKYHWSEDPRKDHQWYDAQVRELDDPRKVNQELDLLFVGGTNCVFSDDTLQLLDKNTSPIIKKVHLEYGAELNFYKRLEELDTTDYYLIGCDTAESLNAAFCAIEVFSFRNFEQIAELQIRTGSYTQFGEMIHKTFQLLYKLVGNRIILCVENNSIGRAPIEHLVNHIHDFNYAPFLYKDNIKNDIYKEQYGIKTTGMTKPLMIGIIIEFLQEKEIEIKSSDLVSQFGCIERSPGGTIKATSYSDLFMATCFCSYVRRKKAIDIMPLVERTQRELDNKFFKNIKTVTSLMNPRISRPKTGLSQSIGSAFFDRDDDYISENVVYNNSHNNSHNDSQFLPFYDD